MDENTWRLAQVGMWIIGGQTAILGFVFLFIWRKLDELNTKIDKNAAEVYAKIDKTAAELYAKIDKTAAELYAKIDRNEAKFNARLDTKLDPILHSIHELDRRINELDKRLYGIETVLHMKDCCVLKQDQNLKKAE